MSLKDTFQNIFGGLVNASPSKNTVITQLGNNHQAVGPLPGSVTYTTSSGTVPLINGGGTGGASGQYLTLSPSQGNVGQVLVYNGQAPQWINPYQQANDQKLKENLAIVETFSDETKLLLNQLQHLLINDNPFTYGNLTGSYPMGSIKIVEAGQIIEQHLKTFKFNDKLNNLIEEE